MWASAFHPTLFASDGRVLTACSRDFYRTHGALLAFCGLLGSFLRDPNNVADDSTRLAEELRLGSDKGATHGAVA